MKKADRQKVFEKFGGKCAYCGCELTKGWHVDEIEPCRRKYKIEKGHWLRIIDKKKMTIAELRGVSEMQMVTNYKWVDDKTVFDGYEHPERLNIENQFPSCASCNINKHSMGLEDFRSLISGFVQSLNKYNTQYKFAKRYGLVEETEQQVVFYFETIKECNKNHETKEEEYPMPI